MAEHSAHGVRRWYIQRGRDRNVPPRHGWKEIEGWDEQERIANEWFTSRGVAGHVTARQDGWRTTNTLATVHGQTFSVEHAGNRSWENV
jgi:hypothetical protein